jgi:hypothetical protein
MLPPHDLVSCGITDVDSIVLFRLFEDRPEDMSMPESLFDVMRIFVGIGVSMVRSVFARPEFDAPLDCSCAEEGEGELQWC